MTFSKVLESIIRDEILNKLKEFNLIDRPQHGFVKNKSCLTNLLEFLELVNNCIDQDLPGDVIYLDLQQAFHKVQHGRLLHKFVADGLIGNGLNTGYQVDYKG